jgi:uncharacterized protein YlxW (UPF0749 family)
MTHNTQKHFTIFLVSCLFGALSILQYQSLMNQKNELKENNPIREIRLLTEGNKEMRDDIQETRENIKDLKTEEQITQNIIKKTQEAQYFSGKETPNNNGSIQLLVEGEITQKYLMELLNILWNVGAENISINNMNLSYKNAGIETAGGQVLLGSTPLSSPYFFEIFGDTKNLLHILNPKSGALENFQKEDILITLSEKK